MQPTNGKIYRIASTGGAYGLGLLYSLDTRMQPVMAFLTNTGKIGTSVGRVNIKREPTAGMQEAAAEAAALPPRRIELKFGPAGVCSIP
jgi:hypothetical protein